MCERSILLEEVQYDASSRGEEAGVIRHLLKHDYIAIEDKPLTYVYTISGDNTWKEDHFRRILQASQPMNEKQSEKFNALYTRIE